MPHDVPLSVLYSIFTESTTPVRAHVILFEEPDVQVSPPLGEATATAFVLETVTVSVRRWTGVPLRPRPVTVTVYVPAVTLFARIFSERESGYDVSESLPFRNVNVNGAAGETVAENFATLVYSFTEGTLTRIVALSVSPKSAEFCESSIAKSGSRPSFPDSCYS